MSHDGFDGPFVCRRLGEMEMVVFDVVPDGDTVHLVPRHPDEPRHPGAVDIPMPPPPPGTVLITSLVPYREEIVPYPTKAEVVATDSDTGAQ